MFQQTHFNDLPLLNDLYDILKVEDDFTNTSYHEDFLETIDIFIDEYVNSHIINYKEKDFEEMVKNAVYLQILDVYSEQINWLTVIVFIRFFSLFFCYQFSNIINYFCSFFYIFCSVKSSTFVIYI